MCNTNDFSNGPHKHALHLKWQQMEIVRYLGSNKVVKLHALHVDDARVPAQNVYP